MPPTEHEELTEARSDVPFMLWETGKSAEDTVAQAASNLRRIAQILSAPLDPNSSSSPTEPTTAGTGGEKAESEQVAYGPIIDCEECDGTGVLADEGGDGACPRCDGTGHVRETIRWRDLPPSPLTELEQDRARLDWLEKTSVVRAKPVGKMVEFMGFAPVLEWLPHQSLREAIDAAMASPAQHHPPRPADPSHDENGGRTEYE